ncbi:hypothetical protein Cgig2_006278 [Carnegiea gigantea]|uniref:Chlororespiratory reduction 2 n=1 Tax=Carnegiea gigantea TaxID=171969 RepID=A0A9Q1QA13_9CARY|nr:hypothetical protein Cgig2_006278 [Carnegiea gigantea]
MSIVASFSAFLLDGMVRFPIPLTHPISPPKSTFPNDPDIALENITNGNLRNTRLILERFGGSVGKFSSIWNALIRSFIARDLPREALLIFRAMRRRDVVPNNFTYPFLFKGCAAMGDLKDGLQIHGDAIKNGLDSNVYVQNTLMLFYGSCGQIASAHHVFDGMSLRTVVSWNTVISSCVDNSEFVGAVEIFVKMRDCGCEPDETTVVLLLSACAELGSLNLGKWSHGQVLEKGLMVNCHLGTALVDMYAKCGSLKYARLVFDRMCERNVLTWTAMISALAQHGFAMEALDLFFKMKAENFVPNDITFLGVLCACGHGGLVKEGYRVFHEMKHAYGIKPTIAHCGAMVDMLGRAGLVKEAYSFIMNMAAKPDAVMWRTLLSACNIHNVDDEYGLEAKARMVLLGLEPKRTGNLVLVSNMYAEDGMWEDVEILRAYMGNSGLKKVAGESSIEIGRSVYKFTSGYDHCAEYEGVYSLLNGLSSHMKMIGLESNT